MEVNSRDQVGNEQNEGERATQRIGEQIIGSWKDKYD